MLGQDDSADNRLTPPTSGEQDSTAPPAADPNRFDPIHDSLKSQTAQYKKLAQARSMLDKVRKEMDELVELGDMIGPEDVIGAAGRLVGHGIGAGAMAELLADMPATGGEVLAAWISQHDQAVFEREQQLDVVLEGARHQLGVAGMHALMVDHVMAKAAKSLAPVSNQLGGVPNAS